MKNISIKLFLITLLMSISNCKSQTVIIRGQKNPNLPANFKSTGQYYYKDVHNYLLPFVGTWEYVNGNEKFQIILTKITKYHKVVSDLNLNFYEDGIALKYRKFVNNSLVFESPFTNEPTFRSKNELKLEGALTDYGRVTVDVNYPSTPLLPPGVFKHGGEYFYPRCIIEKLPLILNEPVKIKFNLYLGEHSGIGNEYKNPLYLGLPTFSIPNNIIMTKL